MKKFIFTVLVSLVAFMNNAPFGFAQEIETIPFQMVEQKPSFNGGDANDFSKWVKEQLRYPESAKARQVEGRVTLSFTVGADGQVKDVRVIRGLDKELDQEAVRVVSSSPKWIPGRQHGEVVNVSFMYPVVFSSAQSIASENNASLNNYGTPSSRQNTGVGVEYHQDGTVRITQELKY